MHPWQQQMEQLRARTATPGLPDPAMARTLSGLEFLQAIVSGEISDPQIARTLDYFLLEVGPGHAVFKVMPGFAHYNPIAVVHGAWHGTLLDSALACGELSTQRRPIVSTHLLVRGSAERWRKTVSERTSG